MKYAWSLIVVGGTLLILGAALPWVKWSITGGMILFGQPTSGYETGWGRGGELSAMAGIALLLMALIDRGNTASRPLAVIVSGLCLFLVGYLWFVQPICGDCPTYSPAFGLNLSLLGALLALIGSLVRSPAAALTKTQLALLVGIESFIVVLGLALVLHPVLGEWLGFWHTALPGCPPCLNVANGAPNACADLMKSCYATATARAAPLAPPSWWP